MADQRLPDAPFEASRPAPAAVAAAPAGEPAGADLDALLHRFDPRRDEARGDRAPELALIGDDDPVSLAARCRRLAEHVSDGGALPEIAAASRAAFDAGAPARLAVVANDAGDLAAKLGHAADGLGAAGQPYAGAPGIYAGFGSWTGETAFLFPGQGSQYVGMGADLAMSFAAAHDAWERAAGLDLDGGTRLGDVVFPARTDSGAARKTQARTLTRTEWAQPAIGAASVAWLAALASFGVRPAVVGGHSFGELTALHAAGAFDAEALVRLARQRGERMAEAAAERGDGAMTAVAHPAGGVAALLASWGLDLVVANHNTPDQVVLSGAADAVEAAERRLADAGIAARRLSVATAFHSPFVGGAADVFRRDLADVPIGLPRLPVFSNLDAAVHPPSADAIRDRVARQIVSPVLFTAMIDAMYDAGVRAFVEVGPGATLSRFASACLAGRRHCAVSVDRRGASGASAMWHAIGHLAAAGIALRLDPPPSGTPWAPLRA